MLFKIVIMIELSSGMLVFFNFLMYFFCVSHIAFVESNVSVRQEACRYGYYIFYVCFPYSILSTRYDFIHFSGVTSLLPLWVDRLRLKTRVWANLKTTVPKVRERNPRTFTDHRVVSNLQYQGNIFFLYCTPFSII